MHSSEVVVVGYGTMKKSDITGAISSADGSKLAAKGTTSAMEALQGSVPGAQITQTSGRAGSDFNIQIRGKSSIAGDSKPLYVVDGVICTDISFLNPQDIERMDILKDASSTAIYGSRATAGVIMVTTKSGTTLGKKDEGRVSISYDGYYGISKIARMPEYMDASQFYKYRFSQFLSSGQVANGVSTVAQPTWKMTQQDFLQGMLADTEDGTSVLKNMLNNGEGYNWPDMVTQDGQKQNHYLSVNGASKTTHYHFGVGYNREEGVYTVDGAYDAKTSATYTQSFTSALQKIGCLPPVRKFDDKNTTSDCSQSGGDYRDVVVLNASEIYLVAAEAYLMMGDDANSLKYLNAVRTRSHASSLGSFSDYKRYDWGLNDVGGYVSLGQTDSYGVTINKLDVILDERMRETLGEYYRWMDLRRTRQLVRYNVAYCGLTVANMTGGDGQIKWLRPIPENEIQINSGITAADQNPGFRTTSAGEGNGAE